MKNKTYSLTINLCTVTMILLKIFFAKNQWTRQPRLQGTSRNCNTDCNYQEDREICRQHFMKQREY